MMKRTYKTLDEDDLLNIFLDSSYHGDLKEIDQLKKAGILDWIDLDYGLQYACRGGQIKIIDYLLKSASLKKHANLYCNDYDSHIPNGALLSAIEEEQIEVIEHLLYEYCYQLDYGITKWLQMKNKNNILSMVEKRDLYFKMNNELKQVNHLKDLKKL